MPLTVWLISSQKGKKHRFFPAGEADEEEGVGKKGIEETEEGRKKQISKVDFSSTFSETFYSITV